MYYLIYIPLYLLSLLPLRLLYLLGDFIYVLIYYVLGYRRKVVMANLFIAFPEKTDKERTRIARDFYHQFVDTFLETLKFISWNQQAMKKHWEADLSGFEPAYASGKSIYLVGMHNFNWEFVNWALATDLKYPFLGIYMPVGNKHIDRIIYNMRGRYGTVLVPATNFSRNYLPHLQYTHVLGSAADQSPGNPLKAYWLNFFGRPTAFVTGPEKGVKLNDNALVFAHFFRTRRGHYRLETHFVSNEAAGLPDGEITRLYARYVEECLRRQPANYLWSHRRWKKEWKPEYRHLWVDLEPPPGGDA